MTKLGELIRRVGFGTLSNGITIDAAVTDAFPKGDTWECVDLAYNGSVDAALALKAELLGDRWIVFNINQYAVMGSWRVILRKLRVLDSFEDQWADNKSPARALLLTILKTYQLEQGR